MREHYLNTFDKIYIDCLNGDKYKTGKLTPGGQTDPSIFSTEFNREGIQVGTAIALMVRKEMHFPAKHVSFRQLWGKEKKAELAVDSSPKASISYRSVEPVIELGLTFGEQTANADYLHWPLITSLFPNGFAGVKTARDRSLVSIDEDVLKIRMQAYFNSELSDLDARAIAPDLMEDDARFDATATRKVLVKRGIFQDGFKRYYYRPFDLRWLYWEPSTKLLDEKRLEYVRHVGDENLSIVLAQKTRKGFFPPVATRLITSYHVIESVSLAFPVYLTVESPTLLQSAGQTPNLTELALEYLKITATTPINLLLHTLAILHSKNYGLDNAGPLGQDWPRVPVPSSKESLVSSAELGKQIATLFDSEGPMKGVTANPIRPELKTIAVVSHSSGLLLSPDDLGVTAGWSHPGKGGITMPGRGRIVVRDYTPDEVESIRVGSEALGLTLDDALGLLGPDTRDIYLNATAYWRNVPANVWAYTIGGYQVIKKWLSYREHVMLGRNLLTAEAREVRDMARRIAALILLQPKLDANYAAVKANTYPWPTSP